MAAEASAFLLSLPARGHKNKLPAANSGNYNLAFGSLGAGVKGVVQHRRLPPKRPFSCFELRFVLASQAQLVRGVED